MEFKMGVEESQCKTEVSAKVYLENETKRKADKKKAAADTKKAAADTKKESADKETKAAAAKKDEKDAKKDAAKKDESAAKSDAASKELLEEDLLAELLAANIVSNISEV